MTRELTERLRDSGFLIKHGRAVCWEACERHKVINDGDKIDPMGFFCKDCAWCPNPNLAELIEACGEYLSIFQLEDGWGAAMSKEGIQKRSTILRDGKTGSTPEEAVANLWLALHPVEKN